MSRYSSPIQGSKRSEPKRRLKNTEGSIFTWAPCNKKECRGCTQQWVAGSPAYSPERQVTLPSLTPDLPSRSYFFLGRKKIHDIGPLARALSHWLNAQQDACLDSGSDRTYQGLPYVPECFGQDATLPFFRSKNGKKAPPCLPYDQQCNHPLLRHS